MKERQNTHNHVSWIELDHLLKTLHIGSDIPLCQHDSFRSACRTGGKNDGREVIWLDGTQFKQRLQKGRGEQGKAVSLVMMCHRSLEGNIQKALQEIEKLDVVSGKSNLIRVEK